VGGIGVTRSVTGTRLITCGYRALLGDRKLPAEVAEPRAGHTLSKVEFFHLFVFHPSSTGRGVRNKTQPNLTYTRSYDINP